ncbi:MAG: 50S ribosomal protein L11 methyltransferase, partial [Burkholderiaceae bacterium]
MTTRPCALFLVGSCSQVLGIAAALLGAERVLGVDNDPQALIASRN